MFLKRYVKSIFDSNVEHIAHERSLYDLLLNILPDNSPKHPQFGIIHCILDTHFFTGQSEHITGFLGTYFS